MASFMSTPSSMKLLPCSRWPLTYGRPPLVFFRLLNDAGIRRRDAGGVERRRRQVAALDRQLLDLLAFELAADDGVLGLEDGAGGHDLEPLPRRVPTSSLKSTRAVCAAESVTFDCTLLKPDSSTLIDVLADRARR